MFDSGILNICELDNIADSGRMPVEKLRLVARRMYEERYIGFARQYAAKGASEQIDLLARTWECREARIGMYATIDGTDEQYRIDNVQHLKDDDGLRVTDLTLYRLEHNYDVITE